MCIYTYIYTHIETMIEKEIPQVQQKFPSSMLFGSGPQDSRWMFWGFEVPKNRGSTTNSE